MPITTPDALVSAYHGDINHFQHVLDCLFIPAVKLAGLNPIVPIAKGADLIHVGIIQNLEKANMVLCDMSSLNANVFFELGIRTAIGKPICVVKDEVTSKVPFDMTVVNYHNYSSSLSPWTLKNEIESLAAHIKYSQELSAGENLLWKYFSLSQRAQLMHPKPQDETHDRLQMITAQIEGLSKKIDEVQRQPKVALISETLNKIAEQEFENKRNALQNKLVLLLSTRNDVKFYSSSWEGISRNIRMTLEGNPDASILIEMQKLAQESGFELEIFLKSAK